jgi:hypothetical protein
MCYEMRSVNRYLTRLCKLEISKSVRVGGNFGIDSKDTQIDPPMTFYGRVPTREFWDERSDGTGQQCAALGLQFHGTSNFKSRDLPCPTASHWLTTCGLKFIRAG